MKHSFFFKNFATIEDGAVDFPDMSYFADYIKYLHNLPEDLNDLLEADLKSHLQEEISIHNGIWQDEASLDELAQSLECLSACWRMGYLLGDTGFCNAAMESLLDLPLEEHPDVVPIMVQHRFDTDAHRGSPLQRWAIDWVATRTNADEIDRLQGDWSEGFVRDLLKKVVRLGKPGEISYMGPELDDRADYQHGDTEESHGEVFSDLLRRIRASAAESG